MYLSNKYSKCYDNIIHRAKSRDLPKEIYTEKHHIIPRSLGGTNNVANLVRLTAKEHRLVHILLPKMTIDPAHTKSMWYALWMMLRTKNKDQQRQVSKGRAFELAKIQVAAALSHLHKGKVVSPETRNKLSKSRIGKPGPNKGKSMSQEQKNKLSIAKRGIRQSQETIAKQVASRAGHKHLEETKQKISESNKGKIVVITKETKQKISNALKGRPSPLKGRPSPLKGKQASAELIQRYKDGHKNREIVTCPHCNKTLTKQNYNRWHGDRCKNK
jgi:5-methylcytosine-specific restriction endonuclease McrA